jgi:hypothetical protein
MVCLCPVTLILFCSPAPPRRPRLSGSSPSFSMSIDARTVVAVPAKPTRRPSNTSPTIYLPNLETARTRAIPHRPPPTDRRSYLTCSEIPLADRRRKLVSNHGFHGREARIQNHLFRERRQRRLPCRSFDLGHLPPSTSVSDRGASLSNARKNLIPSPPDPRQHLIRQQPERSAAHRRRHQIRHADLRGE